MGYEKPLKIVTMDLAIADIDFPDGNRFIKLLVDNGFDDISNTEKFSTTNREIEQAFRKALPDPENPIVTPGGTAANTLWTMNMLLGKGKVESDYITVLGNGENSFNDVLTNSLKEANITPRIITRDGYTPETAISYVFHSDNEKKIMTYAGNAHDIIRHDNIPRDAIDNADVMYVLGALKRKVIPEVFDELMKQTWDQDKRLFLAMPTSADFIEKNPNMPQFFRSVAPSAEVIVSNIEELQRIYTSDDPKIALGMLRGYLDVVQDSDRYKDIREKLGGKQQSAFITMGEKGAAVVTADKVKIVHPRSIPDEAKLHTVGAGDTATGAFLVGITANLTPVESGRFAMDVVAKQLLTTGARIQNPERVLRALAKEKPDIAGKVLEFSSYNTQIGFAR